MNPYPVLLYLEKSVCFVLKCNLKKCTILSYRMLFVVCTTLVLQVAYVLGQLQDKDSTEALVTTLKDAMEHPMVRHEAAEALGSIAGMTS